MAKKRAPRSSGKGGGPSTSPAAGAFFSMLEPKKKVRGGSSAVSGEVLAHASADLSTAIPATTPTTDTTVGTMASDPSKIDMGKLLAKMKADDGATAAAPATPAAAPADASAVDALAARLVGGAPTAPAAPAAPEPEPTPVVDTSVLTSQIIEYATKVSRAREVIKKAITDGDSATFIAEIGKIGNSLSVDVRDYIMARAIQESGDVAAAKRFLLENIPPEVHADIRSTMERFYGADEPMLQAFSNVAALPTAPTAPSAAAARDAAKALSLPVPPPSPAPATGEAEEDAFVLNSLSEEEAFNKKANVALDKALQGDTTFLKAIIARDPEAKSKLSDLAWERWSSMPLESGEDKRGKALDLYIYMTGNAQRELDAEALAQNRILNQAGEDRVMSLEEQGQIEREGRLNASLRDPALLQRLIAAGQLTPAEVRATISARPDLDPAQAALLHASVDAAEAAAALPPGVPERGNIRRFFEKLQDPRWRIALGLVGGLVGGTGVGALLFGAGGATLLTMAVVGAIRGGTGAAAAWFATEKFEGIQIGNTEIGNIKKWLERKTEQSPIKGTIWRIATAMGVGAIAGGAVSFGLSQAAASLGFATSGPSGKVGAIIDRPRGSVYPPVETTPPKSLGPIPEPRIRPPIAPGDALPQPRGGPAYMPPGSPRVPGPYVTPTPSDTVPAPDSTPTPRGPGALPFSAVDPEFTIKGNQTVWGNTKALLNTNGFFQLLGMDDRLQEQFLKVVEAYLADHPEIASRMGIRDMIDIGNGEYDWRVQNGDKIDLRPLFNPSTLRELLSFENLQAGNFNRMNGLLQYGTGRNGAFADALLRSLKLK